MKTFKTNNNNTDPLVDESEADNEVNMDLLIEVRRIFLMALKGIYW